MSWLPLTGAVLVALAGAGAWLRRRYLTVTVEGHSMLPTYRPGQRLLVRRGTVPAALRVGQVVVLDGRPGQERRPAPGGVGPTWIVKRVAAVPGDPVPRAAVPALRDERETRVPADRLVLLGDNPDRSRDSRRVGYFRADRLLGVVVRPLGPQ